MPLTIADEVRRADSEYGVVAPRVLVDVESAVSEGVAGVLGHGLAVGITRPLVVQAGRRVRHRAGSEAGPGQPSVPSRAGRTGAGSTP